MTPLHNVPQKKFGFVSRTYLEEISYRHLPTIVPLNSYYPNVVETVENLIMLDCLSLLAQNRHCFLWKLIFGMLLYVWQLYHLNYVKRFKIVFSKFLFSENLFADFLSIFREYWLIQKKVQETNNKSFNLTLCYIYDVLSSNNLKFN